jgi:hypothetical protein
LQPKDALSGNLNITTGSGKSIGGNVAVLNWKADNKWGCNVDVATIATRLGCASRCRDLCSVPHPENIGYLNRDVTAIS